MNSSEHPGKFDIIALPMEQRVSVVIPSYKRHKEVVRAVRSALEQSLPPIEVIVSNDGSHPDKGELLGGLSDNRVRYIEAPHRANASATRNFGILHAKGGWIALLDDDDLWRPNKLESQFRALEEAGIDHAILGGVEEVHLPDGSSYLRPKCDFGKAWEADRFLFSGVGGVHTSTLLAPRDLFRHYQFNEQLERHEDWEWLLNAGQELPIVITHEVGCDRWIRPGEGLSRPGGFEYSQQWYERNKTLLGSQPRAEFVARILSRKAAHDRTLKALPSLIRELKATGQASPARFARMITPWFIPAKGRQALKRLARHLRIL